ncbi:hypothetical protein INT44_007625 [Umbelopsis vinacea]|uniref:SLC41A/MgtE integral membrane domain-containing protein n=1 Tax=Umbelopsis vinacea TaxID=44442 RepID=A0A8H7PJG9_9FUNG|nr:hypothetical protein INT44_007625 [Umbelopsis vinacea]
MVNTKRTEAIQLRATPIETIEENQDLEIGQLNSHGYLPVPTSSSNRQSRHSRTESGSSFKMFTHTFTPEEAGEEAKDVTGGDSKRLAAQALPSLLISVAGLVIAGWLMDIYQHWTVFTQVSELFILVPVLLNLKGNLEMNLAARFSTSANLGDLDYIPTRNALVWGNLALLQVQALIAGSIAGLFSFILGLMTHPDDANTISESMLMISSSMLSAAMSSFVLGVFMCALIIISRRFRINPDNIACPMASSLGDVVTLVRLKNYDGVEWGTIFNEHWFSDTLFSTFLFLGMMISIPFFARAVWKNKSVKDLLWSGWTPIIAAMFISSLSGLVLEHYVEQYKGLAMLTPILDGLAGNLGSIYASRISTCLHVGKVEDYNRVEWTLLIMNVVVQVVFLMIIWVLNLGHLDFTIWFFLSYFTVSMLCTWLALKMGKYMTLACWKRNYDPDNYVLPYLTATIDVIGTGLLVVSFSWLTDAGLANMAADTTTLSNNL